MRPVLGFCLLALLAPGLAQAGSVRLTPIGAGYVSVKVVSLKERRFLTTIAQQHDFSCGSAALATLLTYHYDDPVTEEAVFEAMYDNGDQEKIRREGFSLLDVKRYLEANGYRADGYEAPLDKLAQARIPAIALIRENGYNHFVVIKGISDRQVVVGDPSTGTRIVPRDQFDAMRLNRILFVIHDTPTPPVFNGARDWGVRARAPLASAISRDGLAAITLLRPGPNDF